MLITIAIIKCNQNAITKVYETKNLQKDHWALEFFSCCSYTARHGGKGPNLSVIYIPMRLCWRKPSFTCDWQPILDSFWVRDGKFCWLFISVLGLKYGEEPCYTVHIVTVFVSLSFCETIYHYLDQIESNSPSYWLYLLKIRIIGMYHHV